ncbi:MAG TPA: PIN domain nuclease [Microthrixaceae bacterium]|nr:PIN domain nuclease [Microthrixaceae bacterium]
MILVDTSAWVEFDRGTNSAVHRRLAELIRDDADVASTEPILMEVVAGARDERRATQLRNLLLRFELLQFDPVADFDGAAGIYRRCRRAGVTPRGMIDCMITAVARRHGARLLALDADLIRVANIVGIELDDASGPT